MIDDSPVRTVPVAPVTRTRRHLSPVWIIPIIAAFLGLWLVWRYYSERGPEVTVRFETAQGIIAGKTPVLCRSVNVGTVDSVQLSGNLKAVDIGIQMTKEATRLLRKDTQLWVVRPRYGGSGISGLSTIVSGNYLELEPGLSAVPEHSFVGLEQPPVTPKGVPGLHVTLVASEAGGIGPGSPIVYKGLTAGKIETRVFHPENGQVEFGAFVEGKFGELIRPQTKFWNLSGIDLQVGADGVHLRTGTLEALLMGGITFSDPGDGDGNKGVADGTSYKLYDSFDDTKKFVMNTSVPYLLLFAESVRGLNADAPVEFRGIRIGTVEGVSFRYISDDPQKSVPVLIRIDPSLISNVPPNDTAAASDFIARNVNNGLRASLKTASFLTGQQYVDLDFVKDAPAATVAQLESFQVLPTISSGLGQLQEKVTALVSKLQALPLEQTVSNASDALGAIKASAQNLDKTVAGFNEKSAFYEGLSETIQQLDETLRSLRTLTGTLDRKPNSIIFGKPGKVAPPKGSQP